MNDNAYFGGGSWQQERDQANAQARAEMLEIAQEHTRQLVEGRKIGLLERVKNWLEFCREKILYISY